MHRTNCRPFLAQEDPYQKSMSFRILKVPISPFSNSILNFSYFIGNFGMLGTVAVGAVELYPWRLFYVLFYQPRLVNHQLEGFFTRTTLSIRKVPIIFLSDLNWKKIPHFFEKSHLRTKFSYKICFKHKKMSTWVPKIIPHPVVTLGKICISLFSNFITRQSIFLEKRHCQEFHDKQSHSSGKPPETFPFMLTKSNIGTPHSERPVYSPDDFPI